MKHEFLKTHCFSSTFMDCSKLNLNIGNANNFYALENISSAFHKAISNFIFHNPKRIKLVTRLCTGVSHLSEHKFNSSFRLVIKASMSNHVYISFLAFSRLKRCNLLPSSVKNDGSTWLDSSDLRLTQFLFFGDAFVELNTNSSNINATSNIVISSKAFE